MYELIGPMREMRLSRGWGQVQFGERAGLYHPDVSIIERGLRRVGEAKARRICLALDADLDEMFRPVLPAATAARIFGVDREALCQAALDPRCLHVIPHMVERTSRSAIVYFIEDDLREQLANLPACRAENCCALALARSGYCTAHKWMASRERMRQAVATPAERRRWLTEDEAVSDARRGWECVNQAIRDGDLRAFRVSGHVIIPRRDLNEWAQMLPIRYGTHRPTNLELALRALLDSLGVEFLEQHQIGNYKVDAYVPRIGLVIEADGSYWHQDEAKEKRRDAYLLRNPLVSSIVHLSDAQLAPWTPRGHSSREYRRAIAA